MYSAHPNSSYEELRVIMLEILFGALGAFQIL